MLNQDLTVIYQNVLYKVDASYLSESSILFHQMIKSYIDQHIEIKSLRLIIQTEKFTQTNVGNFLKICQNIQTDIKSNDFYEICEISLIFQAEKVYKTCINYIHANLNSNFSIQVDKYQNENFLRIESNEKPFIHQIENLSELEFDESNEENQTKKNKSVVYQIKIEKSFMKCTRFLFYQKDNLLFSAKQKIHQIFIADGNDIHIDDKKSKKRAIITQDSDGYNIVNTENQIIKINYLRTHPNKFKKMFSLQLSFMHCDNLIFWKPKIIENKEQLYGLYNRIPIKSKKNIILQNKHRHKAFIVRKMNKNLFEAECNSSISPVIAFSIALSQIVGPFCV